MEFLLERKYLGEDYTIGYLYIDGMFFCNILEDKVRDLNKDGDLNDIGEIKIYGETAIPYGRYKIIITYSQRFKRDLPLLVDVLHFSGIRIHPGNKAIDTHGCLLPGVNTEKGKVTSSKATFDRLYKMMLESGQKEWWITIK